MALSGELSDLSLAELIEFFCNQRKTGRLKVIYPRGPGYFYLQSGSVVHAEVGTARGIEAVYYALTLPNASFRFSAACEPPERTINQPWTSVVLEGLRRMDEGIRPADPFPPDDVAHAEDTEELEFQISSDPSVIVAAVPSSEVIGDTEVTPWLWESEPSWLKKPWGFGAVVGAVVMVLAVIGIPWGWYAHSQGTKAMNQPKASMEIAPQASVPATNDTADAETPGTTARSEAAPNSESEALAAKRLRETRAKEREKAKAQETASAGTTSPTVSGARSTAKPAANSAASKKVTVQVSYDESGRVTQASGADPTALRIARQKRFPAGKPGSATITIPIN